MHPALALRAVINNSVKLTVARVKSNFRNRPLSKHKPNTHTHTLTELVCGNAAPPSDVQKSVPIKVPNVLNAIQHMSCNKKHICIRRTEVVYITYGARLLASRRLRPKP